jgi:3-oxoacyl-[acyl-carrier protein] reductase
MSQKKIAIVTGGSSGIGKATCIALAKENYGIVVVGTNLQRINETLELLPTSGRLGLALDVTQEQAMATMATKTIDYFGRIDLLVASAGLGKLTSERLVPYPTASLPYDEWKAILDVNLTGIFLSNRAVLPIMIEQNLGHIINICSASTRHGLRGEPYAPAYCASKFGVVGFTESLAQEVGSYGIRVQAIFPGLVQTPMIAQTALVRRYGGVMNVDDVAETIIYLATQPIDTTIIHPHLIPFIQH